MVGQWTAGALLNFLHTHTSSLVDYESNQCTTSKAIGPQDKDRYTRMTLESRKHLSKLETKSDYKQ